MDSEYENKVKTDRCCNPYGKKGHKGKALRPVTSDLREKLPAIRPGSVICHICRKELGNDKCNDSENDENEINQSSTSFTSNCSFNPEEYMNSSAENDLNEIIDGLKKKFAELPSNDPDKITILTVLPSNWTIRKIASEFNTTEYAVKKAKKLKGLYGSFSKPAPKIGTSLPQSTIDKIVQFYENDENSRVLPGVKNKKSVLIGERKILKAKRLLLLSLKDSHTKFGEENPDIAVGFSKFCQLRPLNCVLPGASGTHTVCVCVNHENSKLMLDAIKLPQLTAKSEFPLKDYKDCLDLTMCRHKSKNCYLTDCEACPSHSLLRDHLSKHLKESGVNEITFSAWHSTDRATLKTSTLTVDDYLELLINKLDILKPHHYINKQQTSYFEELKKNLRNGEFLVICDFSENYAFIIQNAAQAFHYNNNQATLYTVIYYYRDGDELKQGSIVVISESTTHDAIAVHICHSKIIEHLKNNHKVRKIYFFSDGAKQHFKNRFNIHNLLKYKIDFGITAEWHFHVTAHGKGPHDGLGAVVKVNARKASLRAPSLNCILTAEQLYEWARKNLRNIQFFYYSIAQYNVMQRRLKRRFDNANPITNISINHCFIPLSDSQLLMKRFSNDAEKTYVDF